MATGVVVSWEAPPSDSQLHKAVCGTTARSALSSVSSFHKHRAPPELLTGERTAVCVGEGIKKKLVKEKEGEGLREPGSVQGASAGSRVGRCL